MKKFEKLIKSFTFIKHTLYLPQVLGTCKGADLCPPQSTEVYEYPVLPILPKRAGCLRRIPGISMQLAAGPCRLQLNILEEDIGRTLSCLFWKISYFLSQILCVEPLLYV